MFCGPFALYLCSADLEGMSPQCCLLNHHSEFFMLIPHTLQRLPQQLPPLFLSLETEKGKAKEKSQSPMIDMLLLKKLDTTLQTKKIIWFPNADLSQILKETEALVVTILCAV